MVEEKKVLAVVLKSSNGRDGWELVKPEDVPAWVKEPERMARLLDGDMCMDPTQESDWYRVEKLDAQGETQQ